MDTGFKALWRTAGAMLVFHQPSAHAAAAPSINNLADNTHVRIMLRRGLVRHLIRGPCVDLMHVSDERKLAANLPT
jgi:hypothetical protein